MAYYGLLWQPIMAALGIRKHLDIFYDHLSESSLLETTQSLVRFVKNNIFSYSVKANVWQNEKKKTKTQKIVHPTPRYPETNVELHGKTLGKRDCNILIVSFGYMEVSGKSGIMTWMVAHFRQWSSEWRDGKFVPCGMYTMQTIKSKRFLDTFRRSQMIDRWLFLLWSRRTNACSRCGHR